TADAVDPGKGVGADGSVASGGSQGDIDGDAGGGVAEDHPRVAVAGDGVVAAEPFKLVEGAVAGADVQRGQLTVAVSGRIIGVDQHRTLDAFNVAQRIRPDRGIAG